MAGKGRGGDGLEYIGVRNGKKWWRARLEWTDPLTGKKRNTKQEFTADSKLLAVKERIRRIEEKRDAPTHRGERKRFGEVLDLYLPTIQVYSTQKSWTSFAKRLRAHFGDWWIDMISERHLQDYLDELELSSSSVASIRAILRKAFGFALKKRWVTINPAKHLTKPDRAREEAVRDALGEAPRRSLTLDEAVLYLADLKQHEPPERYLLLATQLVLGCRFAEISALTWDDVDLESGIVNIRRGQVDSREGPTKGKYARIVALDLELRRDLKAHRALMAQHRWPDFDRLVFPRPVSGNRRSGAHAARATVSAAVKRSFARLGWHDMAVATHVARHTMHNVAREHASALLLRKVVGHTSEKMSLNYTTAERAEVIELGERVGAALKASTKASTAPGGSAPTPRK